MNRRTAASCIRSHLEKESILRTKRPSRWRSRVRAGNQIIYAVREPAIFELCEIVCGKLRREAQASAKLFSAT